MNTMRVDVLNGALLVVALGVSATALALAPAGEPAADGSAVPGGETPYVADFRRIVSLSLIADAALADLCEPDRVVAVSAWSTGPLARRWSGTPRLTGLDDLEAVIARRPDLVLISGGDPGRITALRGAGIRVEALGDMAGVAAWHRDLRRIGDLLGRGDEARRRIASERTRLAKIADPAGPRPRALYLSVYDGTLFGGTVGTVYHDVLLAAGCRDAAEGLFTGWPQYGREQVLRLAPEIVVTKAGMGSRLPVADGTRIIELPAELLEDPGPRACEAAEELAWKLAEVKSSSR